MEKNEYGENPYLFLYEQRVKCLENQQRLWNAIDSKLALMLTQSFLFIGFAFSLLKGLELLFTFPIMLSVLFYIIGIWPNNQIIAAPPAMLEQISDWLQRHPDTNMSAFYKSLSCIEDEDAVDNLFNEMKNNEKRINNKALLLEIGLLINIIGVILIIAYVIVK